MPTESPHRELELKLERLKREYDQFLAGNLRIEPLALRRDIEREIMQLTKSHIPSTSERFRIQTLAHRFRSLETQIRNLLDLRNSRRAATGESASQVPDYVIVDRMAIENPAVISARVRSILRAVEPKGAQGAHPDITPEAFCQVLVNRAKTMVGKNNVNAIRFRIIPGENGPKVKGELLKGFTDPDAIS